MLLFTSRMTSKDYASHDVICALCSEPFSNPRILPCLHSFCSGCLRKKVYKSAEPEKNIQCPICLRSVPLPVEGVNGLPRNLHLAFQVEVAGYASKMTSSNSIACNFCVNSCVDAAVAFCCVCRDFLCRWAQESHSRVPLLSHHKVVSLDEKTATMLPTLMKPSAPSCSQCDQTDVATTFYCQSCSLILCPLCVIAFHKDHNIVKLSAIADMHRDKMKKTLEHAEETIATLDRAINSNNSTIQQIEKSKQEAELAINKTFMELLETLEERRKALLKELETISLSVMTSLNTQKVYLEKIQDNIGRYAEATSHVLQTHTDHEVIALGDLLSAELEALLKTAEGISLSPNQPCYLMASMQTDPIIQEICKCGEVMNLLPAPGESTFTVLSTARANAKWHIKVETRTQQRKKYQHGGLQVKATLQPKSDSEPIVSGLVEDQEDGTYSVAIVPQCPGPHRLCITMDGQHTQRSPLDVEVRCGYASLSGPQQVIRVDAKPLCIAVHKSGDVYVGCLDDRVHVFNQSGKLKDTIGSGGSGNGQFRCPSGICIEGDIMYVADSRNHRIQKLTVEGAFLFAFGTKGTGPGQFNSPRNVAIDSKDRIVVLDKGNDRIQILSQDGCWLLTIDGGKSNSNGHFKDPWGLALDLQGHMHISAWDSNTIKVYTPEGEYIRTYGTVMGPRGICVDEEGYYFVSEFHDNSLAIFDPEGNRIHTVLNLNKPYGASIPNSNCLYVPNFGESTIFKYNT